MKDLHKLWPHRWITPKANSIDSPIQGIGTAATAQIKKGETIAFLGGVIVPRRDIDEYRNKMEHRGIQISEDFFICPTTIEEIRHTGIFNHSCSPNIGYESLIQFVAMRNINSGEELTFDYAFSESYFKAFKCNCRSYNCRNKITQNDWKNNNIQKKSGKYFSPYLKKKLTLQKQ